jgi:hypothetical protein
MIEENLIVSDISHEEWREYTFPVIVNGTVLKEKVSYIIDCPVLLFIRPGGTTHRVVDKFGVAHCMPAPGQFGCSLTWKNPDGEKPVNF